MNRPAIKREIPHFDVLPAFLLLKCYARVCQKCIVCEMLESRVESDSDSDSDSDIYFATT